MVRLKNASNIAWQYGSSIAFAQASILGIQFHTKIPATSISGKPLGGIANDLMTIEPFGQIEFNNQDRRWFGLVENICPNNKVELSIAAENKDQDIKDKIELVKKLAADYASIIANLYDLAYKKYKDTKFEVTRKEIELMYFLAAIDLKNDNNTWWLVLEPDYNVATIYNHFLRFTMVDRKIVWANFDINTTD